MSASEILISVIVPVYNVSQYLVECIESLFNQNVPALSYEVIFIDDGSTDGSGFILDEYADKYANAIIIHKVNGGVSSARNAGLDVAKGKYVWFVDSDDFIESNILDIVFDKLLESSPDFLKLNSYTFTEKLTEEENILRSDKKLLPGNEHFMWSRLYLRSIIEKNI